MRNRPFKQVDVFGASAYLGNPLAVVLDGTDLSDSQMQHFAHWTNLSETTFVLPPTQAGVDNRVRIFTPGGELPFDGHPTLGTCHAWLQHGGVPRSSGVVVQECKVGLVKIRRVDSRLFFAAPPLKRSAPGAMLLAQVAAALGLKARDVLAAQMLDNGSPWMGLLLDNPHTVLQLKPDQLALKNLGQKVGVVGIYPQAPALIGRSNREARAFAPSGADSGPEPLLEVRAFGAPIGILEDPVTGSLNASLAQWLIADGYAPEQYLVSQGICVNRTGRVHIERDTQGQVWVGGESVSCVTGSVLL